MMQQAGQAAQNAASADKLAQDALQTAERALQEARAAQGGPARVGGDVRIEQGAGGVTIVIPRGDEPPGIVRLSADGKSISSVENMGTRSIIPRRNDMPDGVKEVLRNGMSMVVLLVIFGPLIRAFIRRWERQPAKMSDDSARRLESIEQAVEAVAVEVERISEGQRFTSKLLADRANQNVKEGVNVR